MHSHGVHVQYLLPNGVGCHKRYQRPDFSALDIDLREYLGNINYIWTKLYF